MKKIITLVVVGATLLTGCATVGKKSLDSKAAAALMDKTVVQTVHQKPSFTAMTVARVAMGPIGSAAMLVEGNAIVATNDIDDPAALIAGDLAAILEGEHGTKTIAAPLQVTEGGPDALAAAGRGRAQYVLDVRTIMWHMAYFPTDWSHYRLAYAATARLIDTRSKAVLASGTCRYYPVSKAGAPTYAEMTGNSARKLKKEMALATRACFLSLKADLFSI